MVTLLPWSCVQRTQLSQPGTSGWWTGWTAALLKATSTRPSLEGGEKRKAYCSTVDCSHSY